MAGQPGTPVIETPDPLALSCSSSISRPPPSPSATPSPLPPSVNRLWRPAAQRNLRNQWSKLASLRQQWVSSSSSGKSHANSLVNACLSQRYIPSMELGVLGDMPDIRNKACRKLFKQQESYRSNLLASYKDMVAAVTQMVNVSRCMRCFQKGTINSTLVQFSCSSEDQSDTGDGGGISVFAFLSIASHEKLADELVQMFIMELNLKRLLLLEFLSISCEAQQVSRLHWTDQLYQGESDYLSTCNLFFEEHCEPILPKSIDSKADMPSVRCNNQPNQEVLQVYLTTWLAAVNINTHRVDEIFAVVGEEMHVSLA